MTQVNVDSLTIEKNASIALKQISASKHLVLNGDIILRTGKDFTSDLMRHLSKKDQTYSHCGIAEWENDSLFVYHAIGGQINPDEKLRRDPFELFCNPYENKGFGIFRYKLTPQQQKNVKNIANEFYKNETRFDIKFDLATDDRIYCSEFIYKTFKAADTTLKIETTSADNRQFVAIDNLFINPLCTEIKRVAFKSN